MSTGRALYSTSNGRALYSATSGRALYSGFKWTTITRDGWYNWYKYAGSNPRSSANAQAEQDIALTAMRAKALTGTDYTSSADDTPAMTYMMVTDYNGGSVNPTMYFGRYHFTVPNRSTISGLIVNATAWCRYGHLDTLGGSNAAAWDHETGLTLCLLFSNSATTYATGADLWDATPDWSMSMDDVNAAQTALGRSPDPDAISYKTMPLDFSMDASVISKIQGFGSDAVYVWCFVARSGYMDYLSDTIYQWEIMAALGGMSLKTS